MSSRYPDIIYFVRHARSVRNEMSAAEQRIHALRTRIEGLSEEGRRQAPITGAWLRERLPVPDAIICSPYVRAQETVALLYPDQPVKLEPLLGERNRGILARLTRGQIRTEMIAEHRKRSEQGEYRYRPQDGESWLDVEERVKQFLLSLRQHHTGQKVVVVGHGNWHHCFMSVVRGWTEDEFLRRRGLDRTIANAGVQIFRDVGPDFDEAAAKLQRPEREHVRPLLHNPLTDYIVPWHWV